MPGFPITRRGFASEGGSSGAGGASLNSPHFTGAPTAPTQAALDNSTKLATTGYADAVAAVEKTRALAAEALALLKANNLADLANAATARTNLGLGTAATHAATDFLTTANFPWINVIDQGAVGDCQQVEDGAITSGTAILTSASNKFVLGDVGKTIVVQGAGASSNVLSTTILSYQSAGQVTLNANASTTVSGAARVSWGTDDSTAIANAITALPTVLSAGGAAVLLFPPSKNFLTGTQTPVAGMILQGYGATLTHKGTGNSGLFRQTTTDGTTIKSTFGAYGLHFVGPGKTSATEMDAILLEQWSNITVKDCKSEGFGTGSFEFLDSQNIWITSNRIFNIPAGGSRNQINFFDSTHSTASTPTTNIFVRDNNVDNCPNAGIDFSATGTFAALTPLRLFVTDNRVIANSGFAGISLELGGATTVGNAREVVIEGNQVTQTSATNAAAAISISDNGTVVESDATKFQDIIVTGNRFTNSGTGKGFMCQASRCLIADNIIHGGTANYALAIQATGAAGLSNLKVDNNTIHGVASTQNVVNVSGAVSNVQFNDNYVYSDAGATGQNAVSFIGTSFLKFDGNMIENAPGNGLLVQNTGDYEITNNRIYNPNANNSATASISNGIFINNAAGQGGTLNTIRDNVVYDDRGTHQMRRGINNNNTAGQNPSLKGNIVQGALTLAITSPAGFSDPVRDNWTDTPNAWPVAPSNVTIGASPATITSTDSYAAWYYLQGAGTSGVTYTRNGGSPLAVPTIGPVLLQPGDALVVTWATTAPTYTKVPVS